MRPESSRKVDSVLTIDQLKARRTAKLSSSFFTYISFFWKDRLQYSDAVTDYISPIPGLQDPDNPEVTSIVPAGQASASQSLILRSVKEMDRGSPDCSRSQSCYALAQTQPPPEFWTPRQIPRKRRKDSNANTLEAMSSNFDWQILAPSEAYILIFRELI